MYTKCKRFRLNTGQPHCWWCCSTKCPTIRRAVSRSDSNCKKCICSAWFFALYHEAEELGWLGHSYAQYSLIAKVLVCMVFFKMWSMYEYRQVHPYILIVCLVPNCSMEFAIAFFRLVRLHLNFTFSITPRRNLLPFLRGLSIQTAENRVRCSSLSLLDQHGLKCRRIGLHMRCAIIK